MGVGSFLFLKEQIKDIIIIVHARNGSLRSGARFQTSSPAPIFLFLQEQIKDIIITTKRRRRPRSLNLELRPMSDCLLHVFKLQVPQSVVAPPH
jgi:hypothetical protein